jgi:YD repeat-containing protein
LFYFVLFFTLLFSNASFADGFSEKAKLIYYDAVTGKSFDNIGGAFADYQAFEEENNNTRGDPNYFITVIGYEPVDGCGTINGEPQCYNYLYTRPATCQTVCKTGSLSVGSECREGLRPVTQSDSTGRNVIVTCSNRAPEPNLSCQDPKVGNPIYVSNGVKTQTEIDFQDPFDILTFSRTYRSDRNGWANNQFIKVLAVDTSDTLQGRLSGKYNFAACNVGLGSTTKRSYCFQILPKNWDLPSGVGSVLLLRGNERAIDFGNASNLLPAADINDRLTKVVDTSNQATGWNIYNAKTEAQEYYDLDGKLLSVRTRNGQTKTYFYSDATTPINVAPSPNYVIKIQDNFGRELNFNYDTNGRLAKLIDPSGGIYLYKYDEASSMVLTGQGLVGNLTSVTFPDNSKRIYWYNEQNNTNSQNFPFALTGITDEKGVRYSFYKYINYNSHPAAIMTENAGGVFRYSIDFSYSRVTDPLGSLYYYNFQTVLGTPRLTSTNQPAGSGCGPAASSYSYDSQGNVASTRDFNGSTTTYSYDLARNLEVSRTEASGTSTARTITTSWHPTYRIPVQINEPLKRTTYSHDANGNVLSRTEQATNDANGSQGAAATVAGSPRLWRWTYNNVGHVLSATGPRTDIADVTTYTYDTQGNLSSITNAAGHVTTLSDYDPNGRVGRITDPNGLVTQLSYAPRGWLTSRITTGDGKTETTNYTYDAAGQLIRVSLPDNSQISYTYDDAHRLTAIADNQGNRINYTLDNIGNRIKETTTDSHGQLSRQVSRVYDALNRLKEITGGVQ